MLEFWWLQKHQYNTKVTACTKLKCQDLDNAEAGHYMEEDSRSCTYMYVAEIFLFHSFYVFLQTAILLMPVIEEACMSFLENYIKWAHGL